MPRYTRSDIQSLVVGQIISNLRGESIVDIDDCDFIDKAMEFQRDLANQLEHLYPHLTVAARPSRMARRTCKECGEHIGHCECHVTPA